MMNEPLGKIHFFLTFIFFNGTFFPMHFLGVGGHMRRIYNPMQYEFCPTAALERVHYRERAYSRRFADILPVNFFWSLFAGKKAERNPWQANTLGMGRADADAAWQLRGAADGLPRPLRIQLAGSEGGLAAAGQKPGHQRRGASALEKGGRMKAKGESGWGHPSSLILHPFHPGPIGSRSRLACATFPLLFIGGLVTSKGAGLAVPDWPTTFGYNMFLYPWSKMVGGIFYEHSHRLVASTVGLLTIALALTFWFTEARAMAALARRRRARLGHRPRGSRRFARRVAATDVGDRSCRVRPGLFRLDGQPGGVDVGGVAQAPLAAVRRRRAADCAGSARSPPG